MDKVSERSIMFSLTIGPPISDIFLYFNYNNMSSLLVNPIFSCSSMLTPSSSETSSSSCPDPPLPREPSRWASRASSPREAVAVAHEEALVTVVEVALAAVAGTVAVVVASALPEAPLVLLVEDVVELPEADTEEPIKRLINLCSN